MAITADMVKRLREQTGAGMMDCKKALTETGGDYDKAVTLLREKGVAVAAKREAKTASEGIIACYLSDDLKTGVLLEMNCETTFVAKTDEFVQLARNLAKLAGTEQVACPDCLLDKTLPGSTQKAGDRFTEIMGKVGEKMTLARFERIDVEGSGVIGSYIHMGDQIGVLVELRTESDAAAKNPDVLQLAKDIAMHISWSRPKYMKSEEIPADEIAKEREIHRQWAIKEGKPEKVIDRIVDGRMKEYFSQVSLLEQPYIKDEELTIQALIKSVEQKVGEKISIGQFARMSVGESAGGAE